MSVVLNLLLAVLLIATLGFGWVLNRRLKALKDSHAHFAESVANLDRAAQRAEQGLAELRTATDQAVDLLSSRIMKARELADSLDRLTVQGAAVMDRRAAERPAATPTPRAIAERIAAERSPPQPPARPAPLDRGVHERSPASARFPMTTEAEALAAAETLILRLSQSEALTTSEPAPRAAARPDPLTVLRERRAARAQGGSPQTARPEPAKAAELVRPEVRTHPRSRAQIDDDLFDAPAKSRLRAFDGGLS